MHPRLAQAGQQVSFYTVRTAETSGFTDFPRGPQPLSTMLGREWHWGRTGTHVWSRELPTTPHCKGHRWFVLRKQATDRQACLPFFLWLLNLSLVSVLVKKLKVLERTVYVLNLLSSEIVGWSWCWRSSSWGSTRRVPLPYSLAGLWANLRLFAGDVSFPSHGPYRVAHSMAAGFPQGEQGRVRGGNHNLLATSTWQWHSITFAKLWFLGSSRQVQPTFKGEVFPLGCEHEEAGFLGSQLKAVYQKCCTLSSHSSGEPTLPSKCSSSLCSPPVGPPSVEWRAWILQPVFLGLDPSSTTW